jgi:heat shock protein HslJ
MLSAISLLFWMSSCKSKEQTANDPATQDWAGTYVGVVPCADCPGIRVQISLSDNTYKMDRKYLERNDDGEKFEGTFQWNSGKNKITLNNLNEKEYPVHFKVDKNALIQLDLEGDEITGESAQYQKLTKVDASLVDIYWKLTEIMGDPVTDNPEKTKIAHITFKIEDDRVSGNTGCNSFSGTYQLKPDNHISFSNMISTRAMCFDNMDTEDKMHKVFQLTDSYKLEGNTLTLYKSDKTLIARFEKE